MTDINITCHKCMRDMKDDNFYLDKNGAKMTTCKKCLTMHINPTEPSTAYHVLKLVDVPFIPAEWEALVERYGQDPLKLNSTTIIGRYLAKMKLKQFADLKWEDTDRLIEEHNEKLRRTRQLEEDHQNRYKQALISEGLSAEEAEKQAKDQMPNLAEMMDFGSMMTKEDKQTMALKWGKLYREEEWLQLEKLYQEMHESYDIQTASHEDYLKMVCKTSLKMNQAIDISDIDGFNKLSKSYDMLMKSAKFTAAQNKSESEDFIDSIGEMVRLCEVEGFIPRYHEKENPDIVDITVKDITQYLEHLVKNELNLGTLIDSALKQMQNEENRAESDGDEDIWDTEVELSDNNYTEFSQLLQEDYETDQKMEEQAWL